VNRLGGLTTASFGSRLGGTMSPWSVLAPNLTISRFYVMICFDVLCVMIHSLFLCCYISSYDQMEW